jgi:hypothetical protein
MKTLVYRAVHTTLLVVGHIGGKVMEKITRSEQRGTGE